MNAGIYLDIDAVHKRVGNSDWYFNLDPNGKLVIAIRRRNILEVIDAAEFQKQPSTEKQKI